MEQVISRRGKSKYRHLLDDPQIKRWYDNVSRGSKVTADVYIRRLGSICAIRKTSPNELIKQGKNDQESLYNFLMDLVTDMEKERKAGSYISSNLKAVKSWLSHNGIEFKRRIKIKGVEDTPTLREMHTLTTNQMRQLFQDSPPETRCICALMAHAGLRPVSVGNYEGTDGLCLGDINDFPLAFSFWDYCASLPHHPPAPLVLPVNPLIIHSKTQCQQASKGEPLIDEGMNLHQSGVIGASSGNLVVNWIKVCPYWKSDHEQMIGC